MLQNHARAALFTRNFLFGDRNIRDDIFCAQSRTILTGSLVVRINVLPKDDAERRSKAASSFFHILKHKERRRLSSLAGARDLQWLSHWIDLGSSDGA